MSRHMVSLGSLLTDLGQQPLEVLGMSDAWTHNVLWVLNLDNLNKIAS